MVPSPPPEQVWSALVAAAARNRATDAVTWLLMAGHPEVTVADDVSSAPQLVLCRRCLASVRPRPLRLRWTSTPPRSVVRLAAELARPPEASTKPTAGPPAGTLGACASPGPR
jgi:hypothetical protein